MASDSGKVSTGSWGKARAIVDITDQTSTTSKVRVRYILYNESPSNGSYVNSPIGWSIAGTGGLDATGTYTFNISAGSSATIISKTFTYTHRSDGTAANLSFSVNPGSTGTTTFGNPPGLTVDITPPRIPKAPDAPTSVSITDVSATVLRISWAAPGDNGGASITNYLVRRWVGPSASGAYVDTDVGTGRSLTVDWLTRGQTYTFVVYAKNSVGYSPSSGAVTATMLNVPTAPSQPYIGHTTSTSAYVWWNDAASNGGSPITNYALRRYDGSSPSGGFISYNEKSFFRTIDGLTPGATYTFTTLAQNAVGWGLESRPTTLTMTMRPDPPGNVHVSNVGLTDLTVNWSAPGNTGGLPIGGYLVRRYVGSSASGSYVDTFLDSGARSVRINGLSPGQLYTFVVYAQTTATDNGGFSNPSGSATVRTLAGVWVNVSGTWRLAVPYVRRNGVWTPTVPYVRSAGVWKNTT